MKKTIVIAFVLVSLTLVSCGMGSTPQIAIGDYVDKYGKPNSVYETLDSGTHDFDFDWNQAENGVTVHVTVRYHEAFGGWKVWSASEKVSRQIPVESFFDK